MNRVNMDLNPWVEGGCGAQDIGFMERLKDLGFTQRAFFETPWNQVVVLCAVMDPGIQNESGVKTGWKCRFSMPRVRQDGRNIRNCGKQQRS